MDSLEAFRLRRPRVPPRHPLPSQQVVRLNDVDVIVVLADPKVRYSGSTMVVGDAGFEPATSSL